MLVLTSTIFSCKKEEVTQKDYNELTFDEKGKSFTFKQRYLVSNEFRYVQLDIPKDAVSERQYIEYYTHYVDTSEVKDYYINYWIGDINYFGSSATLLSKPATIKIPMYYGTYTASSAYKLYKIKASKYENIATAINNPSKRELIANYTWDNNGKYIIFETTDLNAAYVLARLK